MEQFSIGTNIKKSGSSITQLQSCMSHVVNKMMIKSKRIHSVFKSNSAKHRHPIFCVNNQLIESCFQKKVMAPIRMTKGIESDLLSKPMVYLDSEVSFVKANKWVQLLYELNEVNSARYVVHLHQYKWECSMINGKIEIILRT